MEEWLGRLPSFASADFKSLEPHLQELDAHLTLRSHIVGYSLTAADIAVWGAICGNRAGVSAVKKGTMLNLTRWYNYVHESNAWIDSVIQSANASAKEKRAAGSKKGASYDIELKNTEKGVVTRFPPEPS